jgi:hypothetical protein
LTNQTIPTGQKPVRIEAKLYRTPEEYLTDRVQEKINRYYVKAMRYRVGYWITASVAAIGSAALPALVNTGMERKYPTIVSLAVVAAVSLQSVFRPREHWRNYDLIGSFLREEEMQFSTGSGHYRLLTATGNSEAFHQFVERVENAIAKERAETVEMRTTVAPAAGKRTTSPDVLADNASAGQK